MKYFSCIFFICLSGILISCSSDTKIKKLSEQERIRIFQDKYASVPDSSWQTPDNVLIYLQGIPDEAAIFPVPTLIYLKYQNPRWEETGRRGHMGGYSIGSIDDFQMVTLEETRYLYYQSYMPGGNMGNYSLDFILYDYNIDEYYEITYEYYPQGDLSNSTFTPSDNLQTNLTLKIFLEEKAHKSKEVSKPSDSENLAWNFFNENDDALGKLNSTLNEWVEFTPIETDKKLFDIHDSDTEVIAENNDFFVVAFFKSSVYAYNKKTKKYRLIWALESQYDWIVNLQFDSNDHLLMYVAGSQYPDYCIDIKHSMYQRYDSDSSEKETQTPIDPEETQDISLDNLDETKV